MKNRALIEATIVALAAAGATQRAIAAELGVSLKFVWSTLRKNREAA